MRVELWRAIREDINALGDLLDTLESLHDQAVDALEGLDQAEESGLELIPMLAVTTSIRQAMDDCVKFDAHFRKKYGAEESDGKNFYHRHERRN